MLLKRIAFQNMLQDLMPLGLLFKAYYSQQLVEVVIQLELVGHLLLLQFLELIGIHIQLLIQSLRVEHNSTTMML